MTSDATRVLVVDDNDDTRELVADLLGARGYATDIAADATSALAIAGTRAPAAVVVDIGLPDLDGYELARRLRALPGLERVCIIAVTGHASEAHKRSSAAAGIDVHMVKPVKFADLVAEIAVRLSAARLSADTPDTTKS
jgi:two-component system, chemotaxis family, CheB/CheR fusion protein